MSHKLSLKSAVFINLNIMAGAGLFINSVVLAKLLGIASCLIYITTGLLMLPLIHSVAQLVKIHPSGGFYAYAKPMSDFWGFASCWSYFFGKLASGTLILYVSAAFLQQLFPQSIASIGIIPITCIILALFTYLNLLNLKVGSIIQNTFFIAKLVPIMVTISIGLYFFNSTSIPLPSLDVINLSTALPLALYSLGGFEAACSLSRKIEQPHINAPKAIFYSFFGLIAIYTVFQLLISLLILPNISHINSYKEAFPYITQILSIPHWLQQLLSSSLSLLIGCSALGGAYGILFSNSWNLYTLAEHNHTFFPQKLTRLNNHGIPTNIVLIESFICLFFLLLTKGSQIPLQQTTAFGATIAYTISIISLLHQSKKSWAIPLLGLIPCIGFISTCVISLWHNSISSLGLFVSMLFAGIIMFYTKKQG